MVLQYLLNLGGDWWAHVEIYIAQTHPTFIPLSPTPEPTWAAADEYLAYLIVAFQVEGQWGVNQSIPVPVQWYHYDNYEYF